MRQLEECTAHKIDLATKLTDSHDRLASQDFLIQELRNQLANITLSHQTAEKLKKSAYDKLDKYQHGIYDSTDPRRHITPIDMGSLKYTVEKLEAENDDCRKSLSAMLRQVKEADEKLTACRKKATGDRARIVMLTHENESKIRELKEARDACKRMKAEVTPGLLAQAANDVLRTKLGMMEARLKTFDNSLPFTKPEDIVLLDGPKLHGRILNFQETQELFDRLRRQEIRIDVAHGKLGMVITDLAVANSTVAQLRAELAPYNSGDHGADWVFGVLRDKREQGARLIYRQSIVSGGWRWKMVWSRHNFKDIEVSGDSLSELNKTVHAMLLEDMPKPTLPEYAHAGVEPSKQDTANWQNACKQFVSPT